MATSRLNDIATRLLAGAVVSKDEMTEVCDYVLRAPAVWPSPTQQDGKIRDLEQKLSALHDYNRVTSVFVRELADRFGLIE